MKTTFVLALASAIGLGLGCSHTVPPELVDAQMAYRAATQDPGAALVAGDIADARRSLDIAERAYAMHGDSPSTRDFAYIALRRARAAKGKAEIAAAAKNQQVAVADLDRARNAQAMAEAVELARQRSLLDAQQSRLESERQARIAADQREEAALAKIRDLKTDRNDKGLVLTVSGAVLFASGKSQLLPSARDRLHDVAVALSGDARPIAVVGYTDSTGSRANNERLSRERAEAVKAFLVQEGLAADKITTAGRADADPIASNATPEGRADNRRVELIVSEPAPEPTR